MKIHLLPAREITREMLAAVKRWQTEGPAELRSPFLSGGFLQAVAAVRDDAWVAWIERDGVPAGLLAFQRRGRVGTPLGGHLSDYQGIVSAVPLAVPGPELLRGCGVELFDFDHLLPGGIAGGEAWSAGDSPVLATDGGYEALAAALKARSTSWQKTQQSLRRVEKELGPVRCEADCRDAGVRARLWEWKRNQYAATQKADALAEPWTRALLERLAEARTPGCTGTCSALWAGEHLLAAHFGLHGNGVWHYWFPAYDPEWSRYGPGLLLLDQMARTAPGLGVRHIDLGKGDADYKRAWSTGAITVLAGTLSAGGPRTAWRAVRGRARAWVSASWAGDAVRWWRQGRKR